MDLEAMNKQIKGYCKPHVDERGARLINKMKLIKFDKNLKKATFVSNSVDPCELYYIQIHYSHELVEALEAITGLPSYVEYQIEREPLKPVHKRFTIGETKPGSSCDDSGPSLAQRIAVLEQQVASLQAKVGALTTGASDSFSF
ncbi:hypothetical protein A7X67_17310 [Clostridium sp. W14A]|uniref:Uncharacterized protein n=1 Tax=Caproicibacter fermentans TaxID=2576756 RepID=A0A7G8TFM3_9FIRM|nr:hypothetical protein [Caproicibacter fermentans]OCN00584.1 hypothetical protein A7X67_17310 [Clostridium sp. W14A]QNK42414.1 hypothetical protein HCR03_09500 [Caproicibacter fermentans]